MFFQDVEKTHLVNRLIGGVWLVISPRLVMGGGRCCKCQTAGLFFSVSVVLLVAISCLITSFVGAVVWTLPWLSELNEWVYGLVVYGMITDVLSVMAAAFLVIGIRATVIPEPDH